jgi:hypothetical protein
MEGPATTTLAALNAALESSGELPEDIWTQWLWKSDPEEAFAPGVLMNRCHLLGLLVCRHQAMVLPSSSAAAPPPPDCSDSRMTLMKKAPSAMSLRELKDTVDNILIEWPRFLDRLEDNPRADENFRAVAGLLDACLARFGHLACHPGPVAVFDDASCTEPHTREGQCRLTRPALRRMLGGFLVMYRHLYLLSLAEEVDPEPHDCAVRKHHMEASMDDFHLLCMSMRLPVAARLNYKQDFPGMYNHVSQVVYFHNPQYERLPRTHLDKVSLGDPMQVLPALCQLHPEVGLTYEEDHVDLSAPTGKWRWVVLPGRVYLVGPDARVYRSANVTSLMRVYLEAVGGSV